MASPQLEDGYLKIANELVEAFAKTKFSPRESQVIWALIRKTYGWNKKAEWISLNQFSDLTGLDRGNISKTLKSLKERDIVIKRRHRGATVYQLQKDYIWWKPSKYSRFVGFDNSKGICRNRQIRWCRFRQKGSVGFDKHKIHRKTYKNKEHTKEEFSFGGNNQVVDVDNLQAIGKYVLEAIENARNNSKADIGQPGGDPGQSQKAS